MSYVKAYIKVEKSDLDESKFSFHSVGFLGATFEME